MYEIDHVVDFTRRTRQLIAYLQDVVYWTLSSIYLYYKRGEPYLCSAKAPVLDGSGSRR